MEAKDNGYTKTVLLEWCLPRVSMLHLHLHTEALASGEEDAEKGTEVSIFSFPGETLPALRCVYKRKRYIFLSFVVFLAVLSLNYYSLIYAVPGSSLAIFFEVSAWWQVALPPLLSLLIATLIGMQVYMLHLRFTQETVAKAGTGIFSSGFGVIGSIFSSAGCFSCLTALLGFLGTGTLLFLLKFRYAIMGVSIFLLLLSIQMTAKSVMCSACAIRRRK